MNRYPQYALLTTAVILAGLSLRNPYHVQVMVLIGINTLLALGLNLLMGYAGQISLGHATFYGIGAYTAAILSTTYGISPWLSLPCAIALSAAIAVVVGLPTLKLKGYYLGMGTLGFGMIGFIVFREWTDLTGGASGFVGIPGLRIGKFSLIAHSRYYYLVWATVVLAMMVCHRIIDSRMGRALRAIHDTENAARAVGIHTMGLKLKIFVFSACMAALAGFLYAHYISFISPGSFSFIESVRMVTMVVIGGMASVYGAIFGAALLTLLPEWLHAFSDFEMIVYGLILMGVMIVMPKGLTRGFLDILERARRGRGR